MTLEGQGNLIVTESELVPSIDLWRANQLQLVVFPVAAPVEIDETWWQDTTGQEAVETTKRRTETTIVGSFGDDTNLIVTADLARIIWTLAPKVDAENPPFGFPTVGLFPDSRDAFAGLMRRWMVMHCPQIRRIAFTGLLMREAGSHEDAYRLLQPYLRRAVRIDPESTDFTYRINRPRRSRVAGFDLRINRLSTWQAAKYSMYAGAVLPGGEGRGAPFVPTRSGFGIMLQFDVNTDAERLEEFPRRSQVRFSVNCSS